MPKEGSGHRDGLHHKAAWVAAKVQHEAAEPVPANAGLQGLDRADQPASGELVEVIDTDIGDGIQDPYADRVQRQPFPCHDHVDRGRRLHLLDLEAHRGARLAPQALGDLVDPEAFDGVAIDALNHGSGLQAGSRRGGAGKRAPNPPTCLDFHADADVAPGILLIEPAKLGRRQVA